MNTTNTREHMNQPIELIEPDVVVEQRPASLPMLQPQSALTAVDQILSKAAASGATLEQMERFMALAERMREQQIAEEKRQAEKAARADFARFKALNIVAPKTKQVSQRGKEGKQGPSYAQTELHVVASLLQPALAQCNFGYRFDVKFQRGGENELPWCEVTCLLEHKDGHVERLTLGGPPDSSGAKNPLQEMQSTSTFLQRHTLLSITGTAQAGMDNDGRGARGYQEDASAAEAEPTELEGLRTAGRAEAMKGMRPLTDWWGKLGAKQRNLMNAEFGALRRCASTADEKAAK